MHVLLTAAAETDAACMHRCRDAHTHTCMHARTHAHTHMHMATWRISLDIDCRSIEPLCWLLSEAIQETWLVAVSTICSPRC